MGEFILFVVIIIILISSKVRENNAVNNYPMSKIDNGKMALDAGKGASYIRKNMINGKYDKK